MEEKKIVQCQNYVLYASFKIQITSIIKCGNEENRRLI